VNVGTKEQSKQMHTHSPNKPKSLNKRLSARKLMATVFWGRKVCWWWNAYKGPQ
jgi:hypothetical protein